MSTKHGTHLQEQSGYPRLGFLPTKSSQTLKHRPIAAHLTIQVHCGTTSETWGRINLTLSRSLPVHQQTIRKCFVHVQVSEIFREAHYFAMNCRGLVESVCSNRELAQPMCSVLTWCLIKSTRRTPHVVCSAAVSTSQWASVQSSVLNINKSQKAFYDFENCFGNSVNKLLNC